MIWKFNYILTILKIKGPTLICEYVLLCEFTDTPIFDILLNTQGVNVKRSLNLP